MYDAERPVRSDTESDLRTRILNRAPTPVASPAFCSSHRCRARAEESQERSFHGYSMDGRGPMKAIHAREVPENRKATLASLPPRVGFPPRRAKCSATSLPHANVAASAPAVGESPAPHEKRRFFNGLLGDHHRCVGGLVPATDKGKQPVVVRGMHDTHGAPAA